MEAILFYSFSCLAVLTALGVVFIKRPTRALLSLVVTMFALSVLYILLGAPFVAMAHLILYAGAVLVLFLFVIMLQGIGAEEPAAAKSFHIGYLALALFTAAAFGAIVVWIFLKTAFADHTRAMLGSIESVGTALFNQYLIPFELTSLLLLLGVFAAVSLAKKDA